MRSIAFFPDGKIIASGSGENTVRLWDASSDVHVGEALEAHNTFVRTVAFNPDGKIIASSSGYKTMRL